MTFNPDMSTFHYPDGQTKLELELAPPELGASLIAPVFLGSPVAQLVKNCLQCGRCGFDPWVGKIPWRRERLPTPVFWPGEFHGLYIVHGVAKSGTRLSDLHYTTVTLTCDCFALSHQVWEGWMWSRVPQPWVYRREPTLPCGVISPPSQTMCSGSIRTPGAASSFCFTFLQGQSRMED